MKSLALDWTKHLPKDRKDAFEDTIRNSTIALGRIREITLERIKALENTETRLDAYDTPNWSHRQAHINGRKGELKDLLLLLNFLKD